jgi:hypothetical protein
MSKIRIKNDIVTWLAQATTAGTLSATAEQSHHAFQKETKMKCELRLFKTYFKQYKDGLVVPQEAKNPTVTQADIDAIDINMFRAGQKKLEKGIFVPYRTGKGVDMLFSVTKQGGGPMKGTVIVGTGGPGVGKSTVFYDMQAQLQINYPNDEIACVQSEMRELDLEWELSEENEQRKPWMNIPNFILLSETIRKNGVSVPGLYKPALAKIFQHGYDVLFIDSFEDIVSKLKTYSGMSESTAESYLLGLIEQTCDAKNDRGVHTAVIAIQQETKGGVFKGSNKLKHAITGMLHMKKDKKGDRYIIFSKNRRAGGNVDKALFFGLDKQGELVYDVAAFMEAEDLAASLKREKERMSQKTANFTEMFKKDTDAKIALSGKLNPDGTKMVDATDTTAILAASDTVAEKATKKKKAATKAAK